MFTKWYKVTKCFTVQPYSSVTLIIYEILFSCIPHSCADNILPDSPSLGPPASRWADNEGTDAQASLWSSPKCFERHHGSPGNGSSGGHTLSGRCCIYKHQTEHNLKIFHHFCTDEHSKLKKRWNIWSTTDHQSFPNANRHLENEQIYPGKLASMTSFGRDFMSWTMANAIGTLTTSSSFTSLDLTILCSSSRLTCRNEYWCTISWC